MLAHGRRKFFELADLRKARLAIEAVRRIDAIFAIERELNGLATTDRRTARQDRGAPLVSDLAGWMRAERARLSRHAETAKAIDYMLKRWDAFTRSLEARIAMTVVADQFCDLQRRIKAIERAIQVWHRNNDASRRLATIPGVGIITASAIVATIGKPEEFKSARHFAAFLGLTPKEHSTGGRRRLGRISKQGDVYIRRLLILGATSLVRYARGAGGSAWAKQLLARRPTRIVTVALANKAARIIWALLTRGSVYQPASA